jgi:hypothetical protein
MFLLNLWVWEASRGEDGIKGRIREPRCMNDTLPLRGWGTRDKGLGLMSFTGRKSDDVSALKSNGELFAFGRPRNYPTDAQR